MESRPASGTARHKEGARRRPPRSSHRTPPSWGFPARARAFLLAAIAPNAKTARIQNLSCKLRANPRVGWGMKVAHTNSKSIPKSWGDYDQKAPLGTQGLSLLLPFGE